MINTIPLNIYKSATRLIIFAMLFAGSKGFAQCPAGTLQASLTLSTTAICTTSKSNNVTITNTTTGSAVGSATYEWFLLDPTTPPMQVLIGAPGPTTFTGDGEGYIILVAHDPNTNCYDTTKTRLVISEPPTANFTFTNNNQCAGTIVTFTTTSAKVYPYTTYLWDFGDGNSSTLKNPTHSYAAPGAYNVTVTTTNHPGCEDVSTAKVVTVIPAPEASFTFSNNQCVNSTVTFTSTSTATTGTSTYLWDFGDGNSSALENPTHAYAVAGTYNVTLTATNGVGCDNTSPVSVITIVDGPTSTFTFTNNNQCAGTVIAFTNTATNTNGATTYAWDFGDSNTSTLDNPSHTYAIAGTYTVTLTVANNATCKTISLPKVITVTSSPMATFTFTNNNQCAGTVISFTNTSAGTTGSSTYDWNFGDGGTSTLSDPTHTYATGGTYNVVLTVKNGTSCTNVSPVTSVVVKATPIATFTFNSASCTSSSVSFTNTSSTTGAAGTYLWTFGDGNTSTLESPANLYGLNGIYNVTLKVTDAATGCSNTSAISKITVGSLPPVLNFTMSPLTGCSPRTVTFTNTSTGAAPASNFDWDFGNGNTLTGIKDPPIQLYHQGTWTIRLISGNACGIDTLYKTLTVDTLPKATVVAMPLKGCLPINFTALNNSTGGNLKYQWFVDGVLTDTAKIISNKVFTTASNTVQLKVSNSCGTDDTTLTITSSPKTEVVISPLKSTICSASNFMFTYTQISSGEGLTYFWDFGNGNTSASPTPPAQTFLNPGTYDPILIVNGTCGSDTSIAHLQVYPIPVAPTIADTTICTGTSITLIATAPGEKYEWFDKPNGTLLKVGNGFKTPILTATTTYYVQSTILDCSSPLKAVTVKIKPVPLPPAVTNDTICAGETGVLTATGPGGVRFEWFSSLSGGNILDSVPVYITPLLTTTTSYYAQTKLNGCPSTRIKGTVRVNPIPVAPTVLSVGICSGSTATLTATAPGGTYSWYTAMTGGTLLGTGTTYVTSVLTADTAFYVESKSLGCIGPRKRVSVTVTPIPVVDIAADMISACAGAEVNFTNNSSLGGLYNWSFGGGTPAISMLYAPPPIKFNTPGKQLVYLKINMSGCIKSDSVYINLEAYPKAKIQLSMNEGCSPLTVQFNNLSSTKVGDIYLWDFANGVTSTLLTPPTQTYATTADKTYPVTLLITTPAGCKDSTTAEIKVHSNPVAAFKSGVNKACVNDSIVITSESLGALSWKWDFGDGQTSTEILPVHQYTASGTYTIKLVVTGSSGCTDSITHDIVVNPIPISSFTATTNCNSFPTQFTDQSTGAVHWEWDFGDASPIDNSTSPFHIFPNSGSFDVVLSVTNGFGCVDSSLKKITVLERPKANFSFNNICAKQAVKFDDLTIGNNPVSWDWDFGDGMASTSQNTTHVYPIAGQYPVSLIVTNTSGCADTIVKTVMVSTIPTPLFKANVTCLGKVTSFTDLSTDSVAITKWFYDFDDGNNSISKDPNYIYFNPGVYNVSLTVTNVNGCDSTFTLPVTVDVVPKADYSADTICINNPTTFADKSLGNVIKWEWDFGDGSKDTVGPITSHIYTTSGSFLTSLKIYTIGGCTDEKFKMVIVRSDVKAGIIVKDSACVNEIIFMNDNSTSVGAVISTSWDFGDGSPVVFATNTNHAYVTAGMFVIKHTVIGIGGCENRVTDTIFISAAPEADFTSANTCIGQESIFTDKSKGPPTSWSWNFDDGNTSNIQNPKHTFIKAGAYNIKLTVQTGLGCIDTIAKRVIVYSDPKASFTANVGCWGDSTNFINTSNPMDGAIIKTWWDFDDGSTSTIFNPNHILITKKDSFNVKLVIITSHGCMDTVTQVVRTFPIPEFKFTAAATSGCNPFTTTFHDTSTVAGGTIVNWLWNFGDKSLTYKNNPTHTYTLEGMFFVSLTITSSYGCRMIDTLKYPIMVYPKPTAGFTALPDQASVYEPTIKLIDESQNATYWDWDLGDKSTSVDQFLSHTYSDTGTFVVTQVAINQYGCRDTIQHSIRINGEPTIFIPNAFTPDGNGINDIFIPKMYGVREFNMSIYDRYGDLIFSSVDAEIGWNGKVNGSGETVKDDVYIYKIYVRDLLNNPHTYKGTIMVIKKTDK